MKNIKTIVLWVVIAILVIAVVYVVFFNSGASAIPSSATSTAGQTAQSYSGMVGGC